MDQRAREYAAPADMDAMHVLARMSQYDVGSIPVVDGGQLVGIVTRRDIMKLLRLKTDLEGVGED
jgi:CBS domain-containing protein